MANTDIIMPAEPGSTALPVVRRLQFSDLSDALRKGVEDFWSMPTHVVFLALLYPLAGFILAGVSYDNDTIQLLYPLASGFALVGPLAAIWMYELSRRREMGLDTSWRHAFDVLHSPSLPSIVLIAALLMALFVLWVASAQALYFAAFGLRKIGTVSELAHLIATTPEGRSLFIYGNLVGLAFATVAASVSVISLPLLLDRNVGFSAAVATSLTVVFRNPVAMAAWGVIVAALLVIGALPFLFGLAIVVPILGHATWHLYRRAVEPETAPRPEYAPRRKGIRYAADFPASLFSRWRVD
ncbi:MAG: DUF2189 domain-containing protein [Beijerinckiaceae bacterium]